MNTILIAGIDTYVATEGDTLLVRHSTEDVDVECNNLWFNELKVSDTLLAMLYHLVMNCPDEDTIPLQRYIDHSFRTSFCEHNFTEVE